MGVLKPGQIVKSVAGHDKGGFFMVVGTAEGYAAIADGKSRKIAKPKRKNPLHVRPTNVFLETSLIVTDNKLKKALARYRGETAGEGEC